MSEWRTIETAPKDGTEVLGWGEVGGEYGLRDWATMAYISGAWRALRVVAPDAFGTFLHHMRFEPSHWRPAPEPPND